MAQQTEIITKDLYTKQSDSYARVRPKHPEDLISYIAKLAPTNGLVWDVACGTGQASVVLAKYFQHVIATDVSATQIEFAEPAHNITYRNEPAEDENSDLIKDGSVDLVTVAVAAHWLSHDKFYQRVNKVLKRDGIIACWCYYFPNITDEVDKVLDEYDRDFMEPYRAPHVDYVKQRYTNLPWVFETPDSVKEHVDENGLDHRFSFSKDMDLNDLCCLLCTASTVQTYKDKNQGADPINYIYPKLLEAWGNDPSKVRKLTWPIFLKIGKIKSQ